MKFDLPEAPPHSVIVTVDGAQFPIIGIRSLKMVDAAYPTELEIEADCLEHLHWDQFSRIKVEIRVGESARNFLAIRCQRIARDKIYLDCLDPNRWPCVVDEA